MQDIANQIIPWLLVALLAFLVWAAIEIALSIRKVRSTLKQVDETVKKADPLIEHATLTIDAANLEIMRIDQILEDVGQVTDSASNAVDAVESVASAPREIVSSVADFIRGGAKSRGRRRSAEKTLEHEQAALSTSEGADYEAKRSERDGITIIESPVEDADEPASPASESVAADDSQEAVAEAASGAAASPDDGVDAA